MLKRIKQIGQNKGNIQIQYEVETLDPSTEAPVWLSNSLQGDFWPEEELMEEFIAALIERMGLDVEPMNCEWQKLTWKYPKEGPEVAAELLIHFNGLPKPVKMKIEGLAIAAADGSFQFTTPREAELLEKIARSTLNLSKAFFQQQNKQLELSLIDGRMAA